MSNITYDYYRIFYYVGKYGSFTKAAQMLKNSQPNITRAMNNLESQLGIKLFVRNKSGAALTADGTRLYTRVSIAFEQFQMAEDEIESSKSHGMGMVSVGVSDIAMYEVLYPILPEFRKEYPDIRIHISNESTPSAIRSMKEGKIDFAIVSTPAAADTFYTLDTVRTFSEYAVVSKDYNGRINKQLSLEELCEHPIIMLSEGTSTRQFYDELFAKYTLELKPQMTAGNVNQAISMAKAGLGVGFVPESILNIDDSFIKLDLKEEIPPRRICVVKDDERVLTGAARLLMGYIYKYYR